MKYFSLLDIRDLGEEHLEQICAMLDDSDSHTFSWCILIDNIFKDDSKKRNDLKKDLENRGVNLGLSFLEALKTRNKSIKDLKEHATEAGHKQLHDHLSEHFSKNNTLSECTLVQLDGIARFLNNDTRGLVNWKYYAEKFNFIPTEIKSIENQRFSRQTSPTRKLIDESLPIGFTLYDLRQSFGVQGRNLLQVEIDEITETILRQEQETE